MNIFDILIIAFIAGFIVIGVKRGFISSVIELGGLVVSVLFALIFHIPLGSFIEELGISQIYSGAIAFLIIWAVVSGLYNLVSLFLYRLVPKLLRESTVNKTLGVIPGFLQGLIVITLVVTLLISMPVPVFTSQTAEQSRFAPKFLEYSTVITTIGSNIFGEPLRHAIGFFTIQTTEDEFVELNYTVENPEVDPEVEEKMLQLVNKEREERGLPELVMDEKLRDVARKHSTDMFQRGYFSHVDPDGVTAFDRMTDGGVSYIYAGENLAAAPSVSMAHQGLMDSPGHKENILRSEFRRVGIGAVQGGRHGIMFTQKFAD